MLEDLRCTITRLQIRNRPTSIFVVGLCEEFWLAMEKTNVTLLESNTFCTSTHTTNDWASMEHTLIRDVCLYTLRHYTRLCQQSPKLVVLQCLPDNGASAGNGKYFLSIDGLVEPFDEERPPHDDHHSN